ncbi:hypothetical protein CRUP_031894 [Coryphaenoides rupestris]|nr:hypothetical protein CRUP_031894 [Coryphaenoides rupestris]
MEQEGAAVARMRRPDGVRDDRAALPLEGCLVVDMLIPAARRLVCTRPSGSSAARGPIVPECRAVILKLVLRKGGSTENVYMGEWTSTGPELTLPQFYNFLHELERAKTSMDCFS